MSEEKKLESRDEKIIAVEKAFIHVEEVIRYARYHIANSADQHDRLMRELIELMQKVLNELRRQ